MPRRTRLAVLIASAFVLCNATTTPTPGRNGHYMVVAPAEIQAGADFVISVTILDASLTTSPLTASLQYMQDPPIASMTQSIAAGATTQITLQVPMNVARTKYNLHVEAATPLINHSRSLNVKSKSLSLLIQTDKPIYKAGELIQYRAITLYPDLKPYHGQVNVSIQDAKGNRIAQWLNMTTAHGVVNGSLRLSSEPLLGYWTVTAEIDGLYVQTASKTVEVDKYVLPKFEVDLDVPPFFVAAANDDLAHLRTAVTLRLSAKYTYGKCVEGTALLKIQVHPFSSADANQYRILSNTAQIRCNGSDIFEWVISYREILSLAPPPRYSTENYNPAIALQHRQLLVVGEMTEGVSDIVLATNATINVTPHKYTVEIMTISPSTFKRGLVYTAFLRVTTQAGSPPDSRDVVFPNGSRAQCLFSMGYNNPSALVNITDSGIMAISLNVSSINRIWAVQVYCFNNLISDSSNVQMFRSDSSDAIQLSLDSDNATVVADQRVDFRLTSTQPFSSFTYQVLSKGSVILAKTESRQRNTVHTFGIFVSAELAQMLAPSARVLVWTNTRTNEILADSLDLVVIGAFNHQVSLSFSESILAPGDTNRLTVRAHPDSYVGLLAVDQSVIIHAGNGNDISRDDVLDDIMEYDSSESSGGDERPMPMMRCGCGFWWPIPVGGVDSGSIFKNAGVTVFTDSFIYGGHKHQDFDSEALPEIEMEEAEMIPDFGGGAGAQLPDQNEELQPVARTRKNFPETWLWTDTSIGSDGEVTLGYTVPDTITSWVASAFAMNSQVGLGISDTAQMTVFKPFFVSLNLPYSVIRGEELVLQANVFNFMSTEQQVFVTLESSSDFAIRKSPNDVVAVHDSQQLSTMVGANRAGQVLFVVKPVTLGTIMLSVRAQSAEAGDAVERTLVVEPEGAPESYSSSLLFNHEDNTSRCENVIIRLPGDLVQGSARIKVTATGDVMGGTLNGLENLVRMPYGCGEQNMLNFAPNIYVMDYLRATGQDNEDITNKAMTYMQQGYQRELNYQHQDGSFSAFGERDTSGSTWLTAFVVRCFHQARHYVPLDSSLLIKALEWLTARINRDGSFQEPGRVIHTTMQGGGGDGVGMTAYTLLALLENRHVMDMEDQISLTVTYLEQLVKRDRVMDQKYELAIITYALTLAGSSEATQALTILNELATERDNLKFWEAAVEEDMADRYYYHHAPTTNIEATAYALLTFTHNDMLVDAMKIAEWMMLQRNAQGGFSSTQDTVIGLQALAAFAAATRQPSQSMTVSVITDSTRQLFTPITAVNSLLYQSMEVANTAHNVSICASGTGLAVVQVNVNYHVFTPSVKPDVDVRVTSLSKGKSVTVHVCNSWQGESSSGMVVTEVNQLSGYTVSNVDALLKDVDELSRVDVMGKQIVMYFDEVIEQTRCFDIEMTQMEPVANIQRATVKTYPYYGPEKGQIKYYRPEALVDLNMCDVCDICDCGDYIPTPRPTEPGVPYPSTGTLATGAMAGSMSVMMAALLALLLSW